MSRSYKKHGGMFIKDNNNKYMKRQASVKVRKYPLDKGIGKGCGYKKLLSSWDICDYRWVWTRRDAIRHFYGQRKRKYMREFGSIEECLDCHAKWTIRK